jgi:hypothetical protein
MQPPPSTIEFGALPRTDSCYGDGTFPKYEDRFKALPRDQWLPVSMNRHVHTIYGQLDGMCTSNGACGCLMAERSIRGRPPVELSPEHLYGQHSRWGTGSTLTENLKALLTTGVCTREQVHKGAWRPRDWPDNHEELAQANRVLEWIDLNADFDAVATALQRGHPCLIGVRWPGGGGHAVCATELVKDGREWCIRGPNSWGEGWGEEPDYSDNDLYWLHLAGFEQQVGGFYTLTERQCSDFSTFGCWAIGSSV